MYPSDGVERGEAIRASHYGAVVSAVAAFIIAKIAILVIFPVERKGIILQKVLSGGGLISAAKPCF